ncbi:hypothetical protein UFOVP265_36 [uncultured Caudovirales phage]|jgi:hypothetical protein|uniref:Uncharacterized protein n=1 Tax=uncultured Caudovirales phage TaxID=2100421 RepID=A0A6J5LQL3_9CAUD|nr:hypothetical protein UFOVP265_36 [uncultured Caudovirales phage]
MAKQPVYVTKKMLEDHKREVAKYMKEQFKEIKKGEIKIAVKKKRKLNK